MRLLLKSLLFLKKFSLRCSWRRKK